MPACLLLQRSRRISQDVIFFLGSFRTLVAGWRNLQAPDNWQKDHQMVHFLFFKIIWGNSVHVPLQFCFFGTWSKIEHSHRHDYARLHRQYRRCLGPLTWCISFPSFRIPTILSKHNPHQSPPIFLLLVTQVERGHPIQASRCHVSERQKKSSDQSPNGACSYVSLSSRKSFLQKSVRLKLKQLDLTIGFIPTGLHFGNF